MIRYLLLLPCCLLLVLVVPQSLFSAEPTVTRTSAKTLAISGLSDSILKQAQTWKADSEEWSKLIQIKVADPSEKVEADRLPLTGLWTIQKQAICFESRFPLDAAQGYRVVVFVEAKPLRFLLPPEKKANTPPPQIVQVYPTRNKVPENLLKFYVQFSTPMSRGDSYSHVQVLDANGKAVILPFLEIEEELWDRTGTRITLLFDPGRVKRGLKPREDLGPILEEGKSYTLVIDSQWKDGNNQPLKQAFKKPFSVLPPDNDPPDPKKWKLEPPKAGSKEPFVVRFPDPMDYALLNRMISIVDAKDNLIEGTISIHEEETVWKFTPKHPWTAGPYRLLSDQTLEDLAANRIGELFEVDVFKPIPKEFTTEIITVSFEVKK